VILLCDEGVDRPIIVHLRQAGFDVLYVAEMDPGIPDEAVLELANRSEAILITADKDFGELVYRQRRLSGGVVLLRLAGLTEAEKVAIVRSVLTEHGHELADSFSVVSPQRVRIRPRLDSKA
jgi:predicted nuclease of predicted toxin-antitoxin system